MLTTLALFILSTSIGLLLFQLVWCITTTRFPGWALSIFIGTGIGAGVSSVIYSAALFLHNATPKSLTFIFVETVLLAGLLTCWLFLRRKEKATHRIIDSVTINKFLLGAWILGMALSIVYFLQSSSLQPVGDWDGWTLWNMHAKFLAFGGNDWRKIFTEPLHPDYPLLTSGFIAHIWTTLGSDQNYVPILTAALYTFSVIGVLMAVLKELKGWNVAILAGLIISCSTGFIRLGADQYADVPISYYFLITLVLFVLHDIQFPTKNFIFLLIGLCAGFCVWTKHEGWLMLIALILGRLAYQIRMRNFWQSITEWEFFLIGLAPVLLMDIYYQGIAPPNDMTASPLKSIVQLTDIGRYFTVWNSLNHYLVDLGKWKSTSIMFLLMFFGLGIGGKFSITEHPTLTFVGLVIIILLIEYFFTYILTPRDLLWQLGSSLERLLMHVFPTVLFLFFSLIDIPLKD